MPAYFRPVDIIHVVCGLTCHVFYFYQHINDLVRISHLFHRPFYPRTSTAVRIKHYILVPAIIIIGISNSIPIIMIEIINIIIVITVSSMKRDVYHEFNVFRLMSDSSLLVFLLDFFDCQYQVSPLAWATEMAGMLTCLEQVTEWCRLCTPI